MNWLRFILGLPSKDSPHPIPNPISMGYELTLYKPNGEVLEVINLSDEPYNDDGGSINYTINEKEYWFHGMWKYREV